MIRALCVEAEWVSDWEAEARPLPSSTLSELAEMGMDTARLALGAPGVWLPGSLLPDARFIRYCWRGLPIDAKAALRVWIEGLQ